MDGRVQDPIAKYGRSKFGVKFADTITEAGLVGVISRDPNNLKLFDSLKEKILISLNKHYSKGIIVHGHEECAGNPVTEKDHKEDIRKAADFIKRLVGISVPVIGVYVKRQNDAWVVEEVSDTQFA